MTQNQRYCLSLCLNNGVLVPTEQSIDSTDGENQLNFIENVKTIAKYAYFTCFHFVVSLQEIAFL